VLCCAVLLFSLGILGLAGDVYLPFKIFIAFIYMVDLTTPHIAQTIWRLMTGRLVDSELNRIWKEALAT
jgi:hypothetical protein